MLFRVNEHTCDQLLIGCPRKWTSGIQRKSEFFAISLYVPGIPERKLNGIPNKILVLQYIEIIAIQKMFQCFLCSGEDMNTLRHVNTETWKHETGNNGNGKQVKGNRDTETLCSMFSMSLCSMFSMSLCSETWKTWKRGDMESRKWTRTWI